MTFEVFLDKGGGYRWRLRDAAGEVLAVSAAGYSNAEAALQRLAHVRSCERATIIAAP